MVSRNPDFPDPDRLCKFRTLFNKVINGKLGSVAGNFGLWYSESAIEVCTILGVPSQPGPSIGTHISKIRREKYKLDNLNQSICIIFLSKYQTENVIRLWGGEGCISAQSLYRVSSLVERADSDTAELPSFLTLTILLEIIFQQMNWSHRSLQTVAPRLLWHRPLRMPNSENNFFVITLHMKFCLFLFWILPGPLWWA